MQKKFLFLSGQALTPSLLIVAGPLKKKTFFVASLNILYSRVHSTGDLLTDPGTTDIQRYSNANIFFGKIGSAYIIYMYLI